MKIQKALKLGRKLLGSKGSQLDLELILGKLSKLSREQLHSLPEQTLSASQSLLFFWNLMQKKRCKPTAYIIGKKEFFGLEFFVNKDVLIPRPDTEVLVAEVIRILQNHSKPLIIDLGTGSGCIACALAKNLPKAKIWAVDLSQKALRVAQRNIETLSLSEQVTLVESDLLASVNKEVDLIIANLPYIRTTDYKNLERNVKKFEPREALVAGEDGLFYYKKLFEQLKAFSGTIIIEVGDEKQAEELKRAFPQFSYEEIYDLGGRVRGLILNFKF